MSYVARACPHPPTPVVASGPRLSALQAHSFNSQRAAMLAELHNAVFDASLNPDICACGNKCDCSSKPNCCVNRRLGVAYFYSKSHWLPVTPLSFSETIVWMQRARFCLCPPGDVPYNKRYFTALLSGCVPVLFTFSNTRGELNWWKQKRGPAGHLEQEPFWRHINHTELVIELDGQNGVAGFIEKLRRIPLAVVEEKQRRIEEATCGKPHRIPPPL
mmetsp:Transcript_47277/g.106577  ORF Transcript_47277/g.106577 Transcript_47277/m.106577 type:complete len:217 (-) Transcript_47277:54-704(-)